MTALDTHIQAPMLTAFDCVAMANQPKTLSIRSRLKHSMFW